MRVHLPVKLTEIYATSVGAQFGEQALKSTVFASIVGVLLIFVFMLLYYRLPGFISIITLMVFSYLSIPYSKFNWCGFNVTRYRSSCTRYRDGSGCEYFNGRAYS